MTEAGQLERIEARQEALIRGVAQMNETLGLLSAMLEEVLKAATQPPPRSELPELLRAMVAELKEHGEALEALDVRLADLPERIAAAIQGEPG